MGKLFALFVAVPLLELYVLVALSDVLGLAGTILLVLVTGAIGAALAQSEGLRVMRQWQAALASGRVPEEGVVSGALILLGGILLLTPGVITDVVGLSLLLPFSRRWYVYLARTHLQRSLRRGNVRVFSYDWTDREQGSTFTGRGPRAPQAGTGEPSGGLERRPPERISVQVIDTDGEPIE